MMAKAAAAKGKKGGGGSDQGKVRYDTIVLMLVLISKLSCFLEGCSILVALQYLMSRFLVSDVSEVRAASHDDFVPICK